METNKKKQGFSVRLRNSVRFKFVIIVIILLLTAILCLSIPLSIALQKPYTDLLAHGLFLRTKVLLDNLELSAHNLFKNNDKNDLDLLLLNRGALDEAKFIVITGKSPNSDKESIDYILASDYAEISKVINTKRNHKQYSSRGNNCHRLASIIISRLINRPS